MRTAGNVVKMGQYLQSRHSLMSLHKNGVKVPFFIYLFFKDFIYLFLDRKKEGEKHQCVVASHAPPMGDLACNPGMCPDWESNWWPFGLLVGAHSKEPHQPEIG